MTDLTKFAAETNNELFDPGYKGGEWMTEAIETHETLEQWAQSCQSWAERSPSRTGEIAGLKFISWKNTQAVKGHPRQSMSVLDLGDVRVVLPGTDLYYFS